MLIHWNSPAVVDLIADSKLYDFAHYVIRSNPTDRPNSNSLTAHLIHNNAFIVPPGGRGQAPSFHIDDPLHNIIIEGDEYLPPNIRLPVLVCTYMIWLTDCETESNGPTYIVPGSHRFGKMVDPNLAESLAIPAIGKAGTAVLINSQVWHRGCANTSDQPRETLQLTFGRRLIGHKFKTTMNYQMPSHVLHNKPKHVLERFGFLEGGAYS